MLSINLSNGTRVTATVNLTDKALAITQERIEGQAAPRVPFALPATITIPLADLKRTGETVASLVKVFRG